MNITYQPGELLALDEDTAASLGYTAIEPYTVPLAAMTSEQLADAAKEAAAREKAVAEAAKAAGATS